MIDQITASHHVGHLWPGEVSLNRALFLPRRHRRPLRLRCHWRRLVPQPPILEIWRRQCQPGWKPREGRIRKKWYEEEAFIRKPCPTFPICPQILVGNKSDSNSKIVDRETASRFASEHEMDDFFEVNLIIEIRRARHPEKAGAWFDFFIFTFLASGIGQDRRLRAWFIHRALLARVREISREDGHPVGARADGGRPQYDGRAAESRGQEVEHELQLLHQLRLCSLTYLHFRYLQDSSTKPIQSMERNKNKTQCFDCTYYI